MIEDRNKTETTKIVTSAVVRWLDERGSKPIETEVQVARGWVADIATALLPTETELIELKLLKRKPPWKAAPELWQQWREERAAKQAYFNLMTVVVEVKTSRADFVREYDHKWKHTGPPEPIPANLCYIAMQNEQVKQISIPASTSSGTSCGRDAD